MADTPDDDAAWAPEPMIPGARDPHNLTHREPGAVSGQFSGADIPPAATPWIDRETADGHIREGGGADGDRAIRERKQRERKKRD